MDELLIEDKKYVSSKRAAKMTGYAKDYVGQLCREGRVPARLVGRSWYVLESAIQDHRFGDTETPAMSPEPSEPGVKEKEWQSPRYEATVEETLPPLVDSSHASLNDSWKAWFDRVSAVAQPPVGEQAIDDTEEEVVVEAPAPEEELSPEPVAIQSIEIAEDVSVPIHTIYELPPEELLPRHSERVESRGYREEQVEVEETPHTPDRPVSKRIYGAFRSLAVLCAVIALTLAALNTGYLDKYITSVSQASIFTGISTYNK